MVLMFRSRSLAPARPSPYRDRTNVVIAMPAAAGGRTADDALDSARMDDDGSPSLLVCNAAHAENTVACHA
jgi:hypothetical protein